MQAGFNALATQHIHFNLLWHHYLMHRSDHEVILIQVLANNQPLSFTMQSDPNSLADYTK